MSRILARRRARFQGAGGAFIAASLAVSLLVAGLGPAAVDAAGPVGSPAAATTTPVPPSATSIPFDVAGVLQAAALDGSCAPDPRCGGTLTVDGRVVVVPGQLIVSLPTSALTWQELFWGAPPPHAPAQTGLALADTPAPAFPYEVHVIGSRVGDVDIAGLVDISQGGPARGVGTIEAIDYTSGELRLLTSNGPSPGITRVRLNDPTGRHGRVQPSDPRFAVDAIGWSVTAATGFPMCIPRSDPARADDPLCPLGNRPADAKGRPAQTTQMLDPGSSPGRYPDATRAAPLRVGDRVTFAGTLAGDAEGIHVAAYRIRNAATIYTWPGTTPAYVAVEMGLIGRGSLTAVGAREHAGPTTFEGMTTDPSRRIHLYGIDVDPVTGEESDRDWGTIGIDQGRTSGSEKGRWRYTDPCLPFGSVASAHDVRCVGGRDGLPWPPTRDVRVVVGDLGPQDPGGAPDTDQVAGQARFTIRAHGVPDAARDGTRAPLAFESLPFLACGGLTSSGGTLVGGLDPWPGARVPSCGRLPTAAACEVPVVSAGGPYIVDAGGSVTLAGSAAGAPPPVLAWEMPLTGTIADVSAGTTTYTAPVVVAATTVALSLVARNACGGSATAVSRVNVSAAPPPTVGDVPAISVISGSTATLAVPGADPEGTTEAPLVFTAAQQGLPALRDLTVAQAPPSGARITFTAPVLPLDQVTTSTITLAIKAANARGQVSAARVVMVTIVPAQDRVTITSARYRTRSRQLIVTARSSVTAPALVLSLRPYLTRAGRTFEPPAGSFVNQGGGRFTLALSGVPSPAAGRSLRVVSSLGGRSAAHAVQRVRS